jgi:MATE family multidrug resistance protein
MGTTGLTAQAVGKRDHGEIIALFSRALLVGIIGGFILILFKDFIFWSAFKISPASSEVENLAYKYMKIRIYSAPAAISIFGILGWLIAREKTRMVLFLQLWMNGTNILLDILFVIGFGWGVEGVAIATVFAEISSFFIGLYICRSAFIGSVWRSYRLVMNKEKLINMSKVNFDILVRSLLLQAAFLSFMFFSANLDNTTLAANQILLQFLMMTSYALDGFAFSAEALVGQAVGAKSANSLRKISLMTLFWGLVAAFLMSLFYFFFGENLIVVMTKSLELQLFTQKYLFWMIIAPILAFPAFILDGIFIGATRTKDMRNGMAISFVIFCLSVWLLFDSYGNDGLWASMMILFVVRALTLSIKYFNIEKEI